MSISLNIKNLNSRQEILIFSFSQHCDGIFSIMRGKLPLVVAIVCSFWRISSVRPSVFCILFLHKTGHWRICTYHGILLLYLDYGDYLLAAHWNDRVLCRFLFHKKDLRFSQNWLNQESSVWKWFQRPKMFEQMKKKLMSWLLINNFYLLESIVFLEELIYCICKNECDMTKINVSLLYAFYFHKDFDFIVLHYRRMDTYIE